MFFLLRKTLNHALSMFRPILVIKLLLTMSVLGISGCGLDDSTPKNYDPVFIEPVQEKKRSYSFAVHPLHNPTRLHEVFNPLIEYLNKHISNASFELQASRDYPAFDIKLKQKSVDFALPNPYQTVEATKNGYIPFAKMGDDFNFRGIILVRKDSEIKTPMDLKNRKVSYPAPTALAATMMPQYFLYQHGLNVTKDLQNKYVGSQESSIMNVFHGETDAAATWPPPWQALSQQKPQLRQALKVIWKTDPLPNNGVIARSDLPEDLVRQVQTILVNLHQHKAGQEILKRMHLSKFEVADNATYDPVREFLEKFSRSVRQPSEAK